MLSHGRTGTHGHRWGRLAGALVLGGALAGTVLAAAEPAAGLAGGWVVVPSPNKAAQQDELVAVSCASAGACVAVGHYNNFDPKAAVKTLAESWNGATWSVTPSPSPAKHSQLQGVSCVSAGDCTAVGSEGRYRHPNTLVESWNGTAWSVVPSPSPVPGNSTLSAVSCVSAGNCTAVGSAGGETLIESWNGAAWSVVPSPSPGSAPVLRGVSCPSAGNCTAVGYYGIGHVFDSTLVEVWNGTAWSVVPTPRPGRRADFLQGVSCASATACTAVGFRTLGSHARSLVESWNGTVWSLVPSPNPGTYDTQLGGVSCVSATTCTAVGFHAHSTGARTKTLVESWDGTAWSVVTSPNPAKYNQLSGVSCLPGSGCTAVGARASQGDRTLVESSAGAA